MDCFGIQEDYFVPLETFGGYTPNDEYLHTEFDDTRVPKLISHTELTVNFIDGRNRQSAIRRA